MRPQFLMFLVWGFLTGVLLSYIAGSTWYGATDITEMNSLVAFRTITVFDLWSVPLLNLSFFTVGFVRLIQFDFAFFGGGFGIVQWFMQVVSITAGFIVCVIFLGFVFQLIRR